MYGFSNLFTFRDNRPKVVAALIMVSSGAIVGLMSASVARDDAGVRQFFMDPAPNNDSSALLRSDPARAGVAHLSLTIARRV